MKLFRKSLLALVAVILIASFTACTTEDRKDGNLYVSKRTYTDSYGKFSIDIPVNIRDISGFNRYDNVSRIDLFESYLNFFADDRFEKGDLIEFTLYTDNIPYYDFVIRVDRKSRNVEIDYFVGDRGNDYGEFIQRFFDEIAVNGRAMLRIDGRMSHPGGSLPGFRFGVELGANVDLVTWSL